MTCSITTRIAGPCAGCGAYQASGVHLDESALDAAIHTGAKLPIYCKACCRSCGRQASIDWDRAPAPTLHGVQEGLFG